MEKIVILTGAGISAESGIKTFRDAGGLWENHDVMEVASVQGWEKNQQLVLQFYNDRRKYSLGISERNIYQVNFFQSQLQPKSHLTPPFSQTRYDFSNQ